MKKMYVIKHEGIPCYVGQTKLTLTRRKSGGGYPHIPFPIEECDFELLEETEDVSREDYWIKKFRADGFFLYNRRNGDGVYDRKELQKIKSEKIREKKKENQESNEYKKKEYKKEYYEVNKEKLRKNRQERDSVNKDTIKERNKEYYEDNKDKIRGQQKEYREKIKK